MCTSALTKGTLKAIMDAFMPYGDEHGFKYNTMMEAYNLQDKPDSFKLHNMRFCISAYHSPATQGDQCFRLDLVPIPREELDHVYNSCSHLPGLEEWVVELPEDGELPDGSSVYKMKGNLLDADIEPYQGWGTKNSLEEILENVKENPSLITPKIKSLVAELNQLVCGTKSKQYQTQTDSNHTNPYPLATQMIDEIKKSHHSFAEALKQLEEIVEPDSILKTLEETKEKFPSFEAKDMYNFIRLTYNGFSNIKRYSDYLIDEVNELGKWHLIEIANDTVILCNSTKLLAIIYNDAHVKWHHENNTKEGEEKIKKWITHSLTAKK